MYLTRKKFHIFVQFVNNRFDEINGSFVLIMIFLTEFCYIDIEFLRVFFRT